jgi:CheY-like chemotaxis protein
MVESGSGPKGVLPMAGSKVKLFREGRKKYESISLGIFFLLVISVILLSFGLDLVAGILIIAALCLGIIVYRRVTVNEKYYTRRMENLVSSENRTNEVIKDFSHKIREPLNTIVIIGDMMSVRDETLSETDLTSSLNESAGDMVDAVNELTRITAGNLLYDLRKPIRFDLLAVVDSCVDLCSQKNNELIKFIVVKDDPENLILYGDPIIIKQFLINIFSAVERQADGKPVEMTVRIRQKQETKTGAFVLLSIETDREMKLSNGIEPEESMQGDGTVSRKFSFSESSQEGRSAIEITIPFSLPAAGLKSKPAESKIEKLIERDKTRKQMSDISVLLVEDNIINQKIMTLTLKPRVRSIDIAENGREALDKFGTSNYDLILMDIQMPLMTGLVAAEKIRALEVTTHSHIPIIAITANALIGDRERCLSAGIDEYISKPYQPAALIELINKVI